MTTENANEQIVPSDRGHAYWQKGNPDHEAAVRAVASKFAARYPEAPAASEPELVLDETGPDTPWQRVIADANAKANEAALDRQIEAGMKTEAYKKGDPAAVAEVARLFQQKYGSEEQAEYEAYLFRDASLFELTRIAGVNVELPNNHGMDPVHSAHLLAYAISERLPSVTTDSLIEFVFDREVLGGGMREEHEAEFRQAFKGKLTPAQQDLLVKWWRTEVRGEV